MNFKKDSINNLIKVTKEKFTVACEKGKEVLNKYAMRFNEKMNDVKMKLKGTPLEETQFNLHHFTTVCITALLAFFVTFYFTGFNTTRVDASSMSAPVLGSYNAEALEVAYGDSTKIANMAKDILGDQISAVVEPKEISSTGLQTVYEIGDYVATVDVDAKLGETSAALTIETKKTYASSDEKTMVTPTNTEVVDIVDGMQYTYNVKLSITDNEAPKIFMLSNDITIMETDEYSTKDFIKAITDNVDGVITDYEIINDVPVDSDGTLEHGRHYVTIKATDSSGNTSEETLIVRVYKEEKTTSSSHNRTSSTNAASKYQGTYASNGSIGSTIASAALAQVGRSQDCTMLVTNSLAAVGIYYHGWPSGYLSLGTIIPYSQAMPGDIVVYNGHVAVYIGNGMCVHGGWNGWTTVVYSIYCNSGAFTIVRI